MRQVLSKVKVQNTNEAKSELWVKEDIEMRYDLHNGYAICLRAFPGPVSIMDSFFLDNQLIVSEMNEWEPNDETFEIIDGH